MPKRKRLALPLSDNCPPEVVAKFTLCASYVKRIE